MDTKKVMSDVFGPGYAGDYDTIYASKNYLKECELAERFLARYEERKTRTILDLGCGTGGHAIPFSERGYLVTGVDRSEDMLAQARAKADAMEDVPNRPVFHCSDLRSLDLGEEFDAVVMMFAVLGYQVRNSDVVAALRCVSKHLRIGGLFLFDVWYGPAVLAMRPSERIRTFEKEGSRLIRLAVPKLDVRRHCCSILFRHVLLDNDGHYRETAEDHNTRFFFPMELDFFLNYVGMDLLTLVPFPEGEGEITESTWNVLGVARRVK